MKLARRRPTSLTRGRRDTTRALRVAEQASLIYDGRKVRRALTILQWERLCQILTDMDARTGRRDPSKRTRAKKPARHR